MESVITNLPKNVSPNGFTGKFNQTFKELIPILFKPFQKTEENTSKLILRDQHYYSDTETRQNKQEKKITGQYSS